MIRQPYMELTGGNACAAALLSVFENWTNTRLNHREQAAAINRGDRRAKRSETQDTGLWIYRTKTQLLDEDLCGAFGRGAFDKAIEILVAAKLVDRRQNPDNPRDRTLQYRLEVTRVNGLLEQKRKSAFAEADSDSSKSGNRPLLDGEENLEEIHTPPVSPPRKKVGGKAVTDAEYSLTSEIVAAFNQAAGTAVTADAHLTPIVGRIREKPDLTAEDHRGIIAAVFAVPWWSGAPGPNVIYGNAAQFERSIETWRAAPKATLRVVESLDLDRAREGKAAVEDIWAAARAALRQQVPESTWRLWLEPLCLFGADGKTIYVSASDVIRAWCERRYSSLIAEALSHAAGRAYRVSFAAPAVDDSEAAA